MKNIIASFVFGLVCLFAASADATTAATCKAKSVPAFNAIKNFCAKSGGVTIPSAYAEAEFYSPNHSVYLTILSQACPTEHINEATCLQRWHEVCATGNKDGRGLLPFGPNNKWNQPCQDWMIAPLELF
ncbi:hypothetical protein LTR36_010843 [Oleoguttula mirabilis]|uniref:Uncharacterized protein n=1 Tax=Oleoguttula mirabilis TaxID=1507867 RepID=A0AAV9J3U7_9PEZI|nr:hypothetical protein LTR36_010843 [Oleoguttula mirabilis]